MHARRPERLPEEVSGCTNLDGLGVGARPRAHMVCRHTPGTRRVSRSGVGWCVSGWEPIRLEHACRVMAGFNRPVVQVRAQARRAPTPLQQRAFALLLLVSARRENYHAQRDSDSVLMGEADESSLTYNRSDDVERICI
jgi:hypothetical protein